MRFILVALMFMLSSAVCTRYPTHAYFICSRSNCQVFKTANLPDIEFVYARFFRLDREKSIGIGCNLINSSADTLLFDKRAFSVSSKYAQYEAVSSEGAPGYSEYIMPDTIKLAPGRKKYNFIFAFRSKNKMSKKEYSNILFRDTITFGYARGDRYDTVLQLIGRD
ncbi:hypothetical protein [Niastella populi]|uniref:hypothetical protein n=1 Tax=Niastella populi TaxID=550983 RepID=UPI001055BEB6|nr:hypothetical protein [Niastella populi]